MPSSSLDNDNLIRVAAYYSWELDGRPEGRELDYWEKARKKLSTTNGHLVNGIDAVEICYEGGISAQPPILNGTS
jgi:hypothetical protein